MAKDDYFVIVYKVLLYYYACLKRKIVFDIKTFNKATKKENINEDYFDQVLYMMQNEGYIEGLVFTKVWGNEVIRISDYKDAMITEKGIQYLTDNDKMKKIKEHLIETVDWIVGLIQLVF